MIKYTKEVPVCPVCDRPTKRKFIKAEITEGDKQPEFNEAGDTTSPGNTIINTWKCNNCNNEFQVSGNSINGFDHRP